MLDCSLHLPKLKEYLNPRKPSQPSKLYGFSKLPLKIQFAVPDSLPLLHIP